MSNWAEYDQALVQRGDITLWISEDAIFSWKPAPTGRCGGQKKFSDHAIETALMLRLVFNPSLHCFLGEAQLDRISLQMLSMQAHSWDVTERSELHFDSSMVEAASEHLRSNISWAIVE